MRTFFFLIVAALWFCAAPRPAATLEPEEVLVVYNGAVPDAGAIARRYAEARPGVVLFDLDEPDLAGRHTISHSQFRRMIRRPLRGRLLAAPDLARRIRCIVLIRGIPHRIDDMNRPGIGDRPHKVREEWLDRGDYTAASVDSELTLLWLDLDAGEAGDAWDSRADGFVLNPYFAELKPIAEFDRAHLTARKSVIDVMQTLDDEGERRQAGWSAESPPDPAERLRPGDVYLVCRLDGRTRADVFATIERAAALSEPVDPREVAVVLDKPAGGVIDQDRFKRAEARLSAAGWKVLFERTDAFVTAADLDRPVIAYVGYGVNDGGPEQPESTDYIREFRYAPGAAFITYESYNGRDFGGAGNRTDRPHTQLADFLAAGGTFGVGNVWEPFSFSVADTELLLDAFLNRGLTWGESAWSALPCLSWQQIVLGDPLARMKIGKTEKNE